MIRVVKLCGVSDLQVIGLESGTVRVVLVKSISDRVVVRWVPWNGWRTGGLLLERDDGGRCWLRLVLSDSCYVALFGRLGIVVRFMGDDVFTVLTVQIRGPFLLV